MTPQDSLVTSWVLILHHHTEMTLLKITTEHIAIQILDGSGAQRSATWKPQLYT